MERSVVLFNSSCFEVIYLHAGEGRADGWHKIGVALVPLEPSEMEYRQFLEHGCRRNSVVAADTARRVLTSNGRPSFAFQTCPVIVNMLALERSVTLAAAEQMARLSSPLGLVTHRVLWA